MPPDETRIFIIFFEQFWSIINSIKQRDALAIGGVFNVKIVTGIRDGKPTFSRKIHKSSNKS